MKEPITIPVSLAERSYSITVGEGLLARANEYMKLDRRVLIVTDEGVPKAYAEAIASQAKAPVTVTVGMGEGSKSFPVLEELCRTMLQNGFTRSDCVVAVGGGVVGDLAGFAAASYMRGVDFYNVPTTLLSQVDSSVGGKVAINLDGIKNTVGAFYQPRAVLIDPLVLRTLPARQISAGLAEALKMALCFDASLLPLFESDPLSHLDQIIVASVRMKRDVVEKDERESSLRRVLNFGHTVGHGIESILGVSDDREAGLYHGECVALGMLPMCSRTVRERLLPILKTLSLPTECTLSADEIARAMAHDKKKENDLFHIILVEKEGSFLQKAVTLDELKRRIAEVLL